MVPAVLSALTLFGVVVTVPVVLWLAAGWPLAHLSVHQGLHALSSGRSFDARLVAHWIGRLAIVVCWVLWLWTTVCVVVEVRSRTTGRSVRLPASNAVQAAVACLVGTALALAAGRVSAPVPHSQAQRVTAFVSSAPALTVIDDLLEYSQAAPPVRAGFGSVDRTGPPRSVHPGGSSVEEDAMEWEDRWWAEDDVTTPPLPVGDRGHVVSHRVMPRETLWSIAADRLGSPTRWKALAEANYGAVQEDGGALSSDHWVTPGWVLQLPDGEVPDRLAGWAGVPASATEVGPPDARPAGGRPVVPLGGGILGAGVVNILDRMRRAQQRHRGEERSIALPEGPLALVERRLRAGDGRDAVVEIDRALCELSEHWRARGLDPGVWGVRVREADIEVVVTRAELGLPLPDGFTADGTGSDGTASDGTAADDTGTSIRMERLPVDRGSRSGALSVRRSPAPLLVTAGRGTDDAVMVNLEQLGSLVVEGNGPGCDAVVRALALELATSFWADRFDLVLAGFGTELERFTRVISTTDPDDLVRTLRHRRIRAHQALTSTGFSSFAEARGASDGSQWDPVVVIGGSTLSEEYVDELLESCADAAVGMVVIATGSTRSPGHEVVLCGPDATSGLDLLGTVLFPQSVSAEEQAGVTALLDLATEGVTEAMRDRRDEASAPVPAYAVEPMGTARPLSPWADRPRPTIVNPRATPSVGPAGRVPAGTVEVGILGPLRIEGADRAFSRAWAQELVVYLALHPQGVTNEAWATALWPDRLMAPSSLHSTASVARRALGKDGSGQDHLPRSHGRLALSPSVTTDWARFESLAMSDGLDDRLAALGLIRGRPFDGLRSSDWVILEGIGPGIEAFVVDVSGRVAGACLADADPEGATWAARKGLLASPYDERLYRMLLRAADLAGNPAGVESVMAELVQLVADDVEPFDSVHPATIDLYRSLTRRGGPGRRPGQRPPTGRAGQTGTREPQGG